MVLMPLRIKRMQRVGRSSGDRNGGTVERRKSLERTKARGQHDESRVDVSFPANSRTMHTNQPSLRQLYSLSFSLPRLNLLLSRFLSFPTSNRVPSRGKRKQFSLSLKETGPGKATLRLAGRRGCRPLVSSHVRRQMQSVVLYPLSLIITRLDTHDLFL